MRILVFEWGDKMADAAHLESVRAVRVIGDWAQVGVIRIGGNYRSRTRLGRWVHSANVD